MSEPIAVRPSALVKHNLLIGANQIPPLGRSFCLYSLDMQLHVDFVRNV